MHYLEVETKTTKSKVGLLACFVVVQVMMVAAIVVNFYWAINSMRTGEGYQQELREVQRSIESIEKDQDAIEQNVETISLGLEGVQLDLDALENNPPQAPIVVNGTFYAIQDESKKGRYFAHFADFETNSLNSHEKHESPCIRLWSYGWVIHHMVMLCKF